MAAERVDDVLLSGSLQSERLSFSGESFFAKDMEDVNSSVVGLDVYEFGKEPAKGLVEFAGASGNDLMFHLNYQDKDLHFFKGVLVQLKDFPYPEDVKILSGRLEKLLESDSFKVTDRISDFVSLVSKKNVSVDERESMAYEFLGPVHDLCETYREERQAWHKFDVELSPAKSLVSVGRDPEHPENLLVSLNYLDMNGQLTNGLSFPVSPLMGIRSDNDIKLFQSVLEKTYANEDICAVQDSIRSWYSGADRISSMRSSESDGSGLDGFTKLMEEKRESMFLAVRKMVTVSMEDTVNRVDDASMQQAYGYRDKLVEILSSDDKEVVLRLNYRHGESGKYSRGIEYRMPWLGTGATSLASKARFLMHFTDRYANDKALQEKMWFYKLERFRGGDKDDDQQVQFLKDHRSLELNGILKDFEQYIKLNLLEIQKDKAKRDNEKMESFKTDYADVTQKIADSKEEFKKMGFFGRLKMRIFHYSAWREKKDAQFALERKKAKLDELMTRLNEPGYGAKDYLKTLRILEPDVANEEKQALSDSRKIVDKLSVALDNPVQEVTDKQAKKDSSLTGEETIPVVLVDSEEKKLRSSNRITK